MNEKNSFKINIAQVYNAEIGYNMDYDLTSVFVDEEEFKFLSPVHAKVNVTRIDDGIMVNGEILTKIELICSRCADVFPKNIDLSFGKIFKESTDDSDDEVIADDLNIDLFSFIRDEIIISLPIKILCKETCQGVNNATT